MKYKYTYIVLLASLCFWGCEDFLDTENIYGKGTGSYYSTPKDIKEAIAGVYNSLYSDATLTSDEQLAASLLSDLMLGGGGTNEAAPQGIDAFKDPNEDTYKELWTKTYEGIFRCNNILEAVEKNDYTSFFKTPEEAESFKKATLGEIYFMRGFFLFRGAKFFGGMPIILTPTADRKVARATHSETFSQILSDLKMAIDYMPNTPAKDIPSSEYGRANKWVAQGIMARAFLFHTGYMTNIEKQATTSVTLTDGTVLGKTEIIAYLEDCITNSTYKMLGDFRNLWPYAQVNKQNEASLPWAATEELEWAGQDGFNSGEFGTGNTEVMFALRHSLTTEWSLGYMKTTNRAITHMGIRDHSLLIPFGEGWGWCPVHSGFFNEWPTTDPRKKGSILEMGDAQQGTDKYELHAGDHETGLVNKKYINLQHLGGGDDKKGKLGMFANMYNLPTAGWSIAQAQDFIYLRFSDILLMHSEITETADNMNLVRSRAKLPPVTAWSLDALKDERMYEFAFEGLRWFDLVRWGDVEGSNNYYTKQITVNSNTEPVSYSVAYPVKTKGLVPIPESEIRLSNNVYTPNPGW